MQQVNAPVTNQPTKTDHTPQQDCNHTFELANIAGLPEEILFICPKCGTPQNGKIEAAPQQESWQDRLAKWVETQHGTAGWELKLENFISSERTRLLDEVKALPEMQVEEVYPTRQNPDYAEIVVKQSKNELRKKLLKALDTLGEK